jgi:hypothetical protein
MSLPATCSLECLKGRRVPSVAAMHRACLPLLPRGMPLSRRCALLKWMPSLLPLSLAPSLPLCSPSRAVVARKHAPPWAPPPSSMATNVLVPPASLHLNGPPHHLRHAMPHAQHLFPGLDLHRSAAAAGTAIVGPPTPWPSHCRPPHAAPQPPMDAKWHSGARAALQRRSSAAEEPPRRAPTEPEPPPSSAPFQGRRRGNVVYAFFLG